MSVRRHAAAVSLVGALLLVSAEASAYCRTTTCDQQDAPPECGVRVANTCSTLGTPISWPNTCVSSSVSVQGSVKRNITSDQMRSIVQDAFKQWTSVDCPNGGNPNFVVDMFPDVYCTDVTGDAGYKSTGPNYNVWIFRDNDWPYDNVDELAIALTTTQFSAKTGEIYDSDVELNSQASNFTTDPNQVIMDLPSVVQHEAGHFLGLAHTQVLTDAVMLFSLSNGTVRRTLQTDDIQAICAAYPPGKLNPDCDPEPRHGFSAECEFNKGCCTIAPGHSTRRQGSRGALFVGLFLTAGVFRRRNRGSRRIVSKC